MRQNVPSLRSKNAITANTCSEGKLQEVNILSNTVQAEVIAIISDVLSLPVSLEWLAITCKTLSSRRQLNKSCNKPAACFDVLTSEFKKPESYHNMKIILHKLTNC